MKRNRTFLLIPVAALVTVLIMVGTFYGAPYQPPRTPIPALENLVKPITQTRAFTDTPLVKKGLLVADNAHWNSFGENELSVFLGRVTARGFNVAYTGVSSDREAELADKLRQAQAYAVVLPWRDFSEAEVQTVKSFVDKGGRLLLVGDATRTHKLNSLSQVFGVTFESDYLYNVKEHDVMFQDIYLRDFQSDEVTKGLKQVAFYTASSITSDGKGLIYSDADTFSSMRERSGRFVAAVRTGQGNVVAISDLTFMIPPYNAVYDNDQLIANLADFVTQGERDYYLEDFPNFLQQDVSVVALREELVPVAQHFRTIAARSGRSAQMAYPEDPAKDSVILGLWDDGPALDYYLSSGGVSVRDTVRTSVSRDISRSGTSMLYLYKTYGRRVLIVLGEDRDGLDAAVSKLDSGEFRKSLMGPNLAVIFSGNTNSKGK